MGITPLPSLRASPHCHHCWASPHCHHCRHCPTPITVDVAQPPSLLGITLLPSLLGITPPPSLWALPNPHHCRHCPIPSLWALPHIHHCRHYLLHTYPWGHFPTPITVGNNIQLSKPQHCWSWTFLLEGIIQESLLHCSAWWDPRASCHPSLATE